MKPCIDHIWTKSWVDGGFFCSECGEPMPKATAAAGGLGDRQRRVLFVLEDGEWHDGPELTHPEVGGSEGLRRLRELRAKGYQIEMRKKAKGRTTRQYRLVQGKGLF